MRMVYLRAALCGAALVTASACNDDPTGPGLGGGLGPGSGGLSAPRSMERFSVDVRASGSFRPGQPIQITVTGKANLRTGDAAVQLVLPQAAAARRAGWARMEYGEDGSVEAEFVDRHSMARGQSLTRTANVTIPKPGYYQVVASVYQRSAAATDEQPSGGELVQDVAHEEIWLWVAESGGQATEAFEPERIPADMHQVPGPLTPLSQAPPATGTETRTGPRAQRSRAPGGPRLSHAGYADYVDLHAMYYNNDVSALRPIPNARYEYLIYNRAGTYVRTEPSGLTDAEGLTYVQCYKDASGYYGKYKLRVLLDNERLTLEAPVAIDTQLRDFASTCGLAGNVEAAGTSLQRERSHVYTNLDRIIRAADSFFGRQNPDINVRLVDHPYSTYEWDLAGKPLVIDTQPVSGDASAIWGTYGVFVQAHEYGHAYQEESLGGVKRYYYPYPGGPSVCPPRHDMEALTNLQCALAEGFADYFAVTILGSATGTIFTDMEGGRYSPSATSQYTHLRAGADGSRVQGAVASFLYDITDPANEPHDQTHYPGTYVAEVIRTCQVYQGGWRLNSGVDDLVYCFQGTVWETHLFPSRTPAPTSHQEAAADPEVYDTRYHKIRKNFQKNLFGNTV